MGSPGNDELRMTCSDLHFKKMYYDWNRPKRSKDGSRDITPATIIHGEVMTAWAKVTAVGMIRKCWVPDLFRRWK